MHDKDGLAGGVGPATQDEGGPGTLLGGAWIDGPQATVREPGIVWCYGLTDAGTGRVEARLSPADSPFRWVHLNLSDQRSRRWLEREAMLPAAIQTLMLGRDSHQRYVIERGLLGLVVHDLERGLDPSSIGRIGALYVVLAPGMIVTGRYRPLHGFDLVRERLEKGVVIEDVAAGLAFLLNTLSDSMASLVLDLSTELLDAEQGLLVDDEAPDTRDLIGARRRSAQLHRMIGGLRATLQRMERDPLLAADLVALARQAQPRLRALDGDIVMAQNQLKLLRDELDLQAAQRTNANVYLLSILTALMMPATLVTGFFGMNTGGLPFAQGPFGTLMASGVALLSAAGTWLLLRAMGLVRRG